MPDDPNTRNLREAAHQLSKAWVGSQPDPHRIDRQMLIAVGKFLWPLSYGHSKDDREAFDKLATFYEHVGNTSPKDSVAYVSAMGFLYLPDQQIIQMAAARWVDQGLPTIQMGHKFASLLMATTIEKTDLSEVPIPWESFLIDIPSGLLSVENEGKMYEVRHVLVQHQTTMHKSGPTWTYIAITDSNVTLWQHGLPMDQLVKDFNQGEIDWSDYSFGYHTNDRDERVNLLIGRLIVGVCLTLSGKDRPKKIGKSHKYKGDIRTASEPMHRVFQIGRPLKLDCRQGISDYLEGTGRKVNVQTLVRGHWKQQPCGPGGKDRKWIAIEPYWRGPEDAPIVDRSHKL